ncbi:MAG: hypothetical protein ABIP97_06275, partial [Chthoniobacterales bacterium]
TENPRVGGSIPSPATTLKTSDGTKFRFLEIRRIAATRSDDNYLEIFIMPSKKIHSPIASKAVSTLRAKLPRHMLKGIEKADTSCICDDLAVRASRILARESIAHSVLVTKGLRQTRLVKNGCAYRPENSSKEATLQFLQGMRHTLLLVDDTVLDFTIRQFMPKAKIPYVIKMGTLQRQWSKIIEIPPGRSLPKAVDSAWENLSKSS